MRGLDIREIVPTGLSYVSNGMLLKNGTYYLFEDY